MTEQGDELLERLGPGHPDPMGSTLRDGGVNFAVFSDNAQAIELRIFDADGVRELKAAAIASRSFDHLFGEQRKALRDRQPSALAVFSALAKT
jgi:pullulanase/glycogen debranching enzyme